MKFKVKVLDLTTGGVPVAVFHYNDLNKLGIKPRNIVILKDHNIDFGAVVDATFNLVKEGEIGINKYLAKIFGDCEELEVVPQVISKATQYIRKKLMGQELSKDEIKEIIEAIVDLRIPEAEIGAFIAACQTV
jgi:AMP phosphorylase